MRHIEAAVTIWRAFKKSGGLLWATTLTYTALFAIVPLIAVALSLFKAFGGFEEIQRNTLPILFDMLDPSRKVHFMQLIQKYVNNIHAGALGSIGTIVFILASIPLYMGAERAINTLWGKSEDRPIWIRFAVCWVIITLGPFAIIVALSGLSFISRFLPGFPFMKSIKTIMVIFIIMALFLIYKIVPNTAVRNKPAFIGALAGGFSWILAYHLYQTYMIYATASFNIYRSLGAIPVFLLWIYINWIILLVGVQITKYVQYPGMGDGDGYNTPTNLFLASAEMLKLLFSGMNNGVYYTEAMLLRDLRSPPEVTSTAIQRLRSAGIVTMKGDIILPALAMQDIKISNLIEIFLGHIEEDVFKRLSIDIPSLSEYSLADL